MPLSCWYIRDLVKCNGCRDLANPIPHGLKTEQNVPNSRGFFKITTWSALAKAKPIQDHAGESRSVQACLPTVPNSDFFLR